MKTEDLAQLISAVAQAVETMEANTQAVLSVMSELAKPVALVRDARGRTIGAERVE